MPHNKPLVTIGVAVYNGGKYIVETLDSINNQTYPNIEIIIVDDGSKDDSYNICVSWSQSSRFPALILRNIVNLGLPKTRNVILSNTNGKYLNLFDQDDIMLPGKIETDVTLFEKQDDTVAILYSKLKLINETNEFIEQDYFERIGFNGQAVKDTFIELTKLNFIPAPTVIVRTEALKKSGGYDESLQFDDWDMWLKLSIKYKLLFSNITNVYYRLHNSSMMADNKPELIIVRNNANIRMLKKYLGLKKNYDQAILRKLKELSIYSYFLGDKNAPENLSWYLNKKFDVKIWLYYLLANAGIKHISKLKSSFSLTGDR